MNFSVLEMLPGQPGSRRTPTSSVGSPAAFLRRSNLSDKMENALRAKTHVLCTFSIMTLILGTGCLKKFYTLTVIIFPDPEECLSALFPCCICCPPDLRPQRLPGRNGRSRWLTFWHKHVGDHHEPSQDEEGGHCGSAAHINHGGGGHQHGWDVHDPKQDLYQVYAESKLLQVHGQAIVSHGVGEPRRGSRMVGDHPTCSATGDTAPDSNQRTDSLPVSRDQMQGYMTLSPHWDLRGRCISRKLRHRRPADLLQVTRVVWSP